ncbi:3'-5' exonuclease [Paenibacillus sp. UNC451MF]|uniref:3'-5' exonuclease n=1 Tax=Paenibacillus sp. UNC451MF TaxID=1449063 RepID=UPI0018CC7378
MSIQRFKGSHSIPIMSIHKSKGLEYKAVFLIGLEDSAFFGSNMDEELCTFFVAVSRAIEHLYITRCVKRNDEGNTVSKVKLF